MQLKLVLLGTMASLCLNSATYADFVKDTTSNLYLKNFYFNRNFDDSNSKDLSNWSQATTITVNSGYTDAPLQLGLDLSARYAYRLSNAKNIVDNVMPYDEGRQEQAQDQLKLGVTAKFKYAKTELKVGELAPKLPIVHTDTAMQLPTTFLGGILESTDLSNRKLTLGRLTKVSGRNAENYNKFQLVNGKNKAQADALDFIGIDYDFQNQQIRYFFAKLEDIYDQNFLSYEYRHDFNENIHLRSNFYLFDTQESGDSLEGDIDNQVYATIHMLNYNNHTFGVGYKYVTGDNAFPLLADWVPQVYSANWSVGTYMQQDERSWQVRYDYDFKNTPLSGFKTIVRYYNGDNIKTKTGNDGTEKELDFILNYNFQQRQLHGLALTWLYADYKNLVSKDFIENRISVSYSYDF